MYKMPNLVAEIGCNHMGDINFAEELIELAKQSNIKYVKFQKRDIDSHLHSSLYKNPHPNINHAFGETYEKHRRFLEFNIDQHKYLKEKAESLNMIYSCSVWDLVSAKEIIALNTDFIKVPSAVNNNFEVLRALRDDYDGIVQISTGMTTNKEIEDIINFFSKKERSSKKLILYSCTSGYPVSFSDCCILEITKLKKKYSNDVLDFGFSGHHLGIAVDIAAYTLGASWIERHFTKDRTLKGTDHSASLEPAGLAKLNRDLNNVFMSLNFKKEDILDVEKIQRDKLKNI